MTAEERKVDPLLADLKAARWIAYSLDDLVDRTIVAARRRTPPYTWQQIGKALGVSGQAVGQHARTRRLSVRRLTPHEYAELAARGRAALGRPPLG